MSFGINSGQQARVQSPHLAQEFGLKKTALGPGFALPCPPAATRHGSERARLRAGQTAPEIARVVESSVGRLCYYCRSLGDTNRDVGVAVSFRHFVYDFALRAQIFG
jgi:hypothetical protein